IPNLALDFQAALIELEREFPAALLRVDIGKAAGGIRNQALKILGLADFEAALERVNGVAVIVLGNVRVPDVEVRARGAGLVVELLIDLQRLFVQLKRGRRLARISKDDTALVKHVGQSRFVARGSIEFFR